MLQSVNFRLFVVGDSLSDWIQVFSVVNVEGSYYERVTVTVRINTITNRKG